MVTRVSGRLSRRRITEVNAVQRVVSGHREVRSWVSTGMRHASVAFALSVALNVFGVTARADSVPTDSSPYIKFSNMTFRCPTCARNIDGTCEIVEVGALGIPEQIAVPCDDAGWRLLGSVDLDKYEGELPSASELYLFLVNQDGSPFRVRRKAVQMLQYNEEGKAFLRYLLRRPGMMLPWDTLEIGSTVARTMRALEPQNLAPIALATMLPRVIDYLTLPHAYSRYSTAADAMIRFGAETLFVLVALFSYLYLRVLRQEDALSKMRKARHRPRRSARTGRRERAIPLDAAFYMPPEPTEKNERIELVELLEFFELNPGSGRDDLKRAYRRRVKLYHPDITQNSSITEFSEIKRNYDRAWTLLEKYSMTNGPRILQ